jgi:phosphopantothenoylcysteine decarboxylase / phosphopantothenate---cysteine ligase
LGRVLLGVTGGIAAYKACELTRLLRRAGHEVRVVVTEHALRFVSALTLQALSGNPVRHDLFDPGAESEISHIELADWADVFAIAPATANTLAKLAQGQADDLLTTLALAIRAPLLLAPAMNVNMFRHAATQANLDLLAKRGACFVGPASGELACGWEGEGRLSEPAAIAAQIERLLGSGRLAGETVLITAGPTAEPVDPVRVITNRSSGKMGYAIAEEAAARGAEVVLVSGPVALSTPHGVTRIDVETTQQMLDAVLGALERATIVIAAAAVSDYRVAAPAARKMKREGRTSLSLELVQNPDISVEVARRKGSRLLVGFAAETEELLRNAREKRARKGYDLIVANDVSRPEIGFSSDNNEVLLIGPQDADVVQVPEGSKRDVARRILDRVAELR